MFVNFCFDNRIAGGRDPSTKSTRCGISSRQKKKSMRTKEYYNGPVL